VGASDRDRGDLHVPLLGAHPQTLLDNPAVDVIKSIPSVWDGSLTIDIRAGGGFIARLTR
jgi:hypothetical protein